MNTETVRVYIQSHNIVAAGHHSQSDTLLSQHASAKPTADQQPSPTFNQEEELLYENQNSVSATNNLHYTLDLPSTEYSYTAVARSGQLRTKVDPSRDIELQSCVAYSSPT